jgi:hypothetical protein
MNAPITSIVISRIDPDYSASHIYDLFHQHGYAIISRITLVKYIERNIIFGYEYEYIRAYAYIHHWHNTDKAEQMKNSLQYRNIPYIVNNLNDNEELIMWHVFDNSNNTDITKNPAYASKTTVFIPDLTDETYFDGETPSITISL